MRRRGNEALPPSSSPRVRPTWTTGWLANPLGRPRWIAVYVVLFLLWSIIPVVIAVQFSFNAGRSLTQWQGFSLRWYWGDHSLSVRTDPGLRSALLQTLKLGLLNMVVATPIGVFLAVGISRWRSRLSSLAGAAVLFAFVLPEIVLAVAFLLVVTKLYTLVPLGTWAQLWGHVTLSVPIVAIVVRGRVAALGISYEEAAMDLGASPMQTLRLIVAPLLAPAIMASFFLCFAVSIDDFVFSQYLSSDQSTATIPMYLYGSARGFPSPALNALATIMTVISVSSTAAALLAYRALTRNERRARGTSQQEDAITT